MSVARVFGVTALAAVLSVGTALIGGHWFGEGASDPAGLPSGAARLRTLPDLGFLDPAGQTVDRSAWAGKVLVLHFWATWCPGAARDLQTLTGLQASLAGRGGQVVGVAIDRAADVAAFVTRHPVTFPMLTGGPEAIDLALGLGDWVQGLPFTAIFDQRGRLVFSQLGPVDARALEGRLDGLLGQSSRGGATGDR